MLQHVLQKAKVDAQRFGRVLESEFPAMSYRSAEVAFWWIQSPFERSQLVVPQLYSEKRGKIVSCIAMISHLKDNYYKTFNSAHFPRLFNEMVSESVKSRTLAQNNAHYHSERDATCHIPLGLNDRMIVWRKTNNVKYGVVWRICSWYCDRWRRSAAPTSTVLICSSSYVKNVVTNNFPNTIKTNCSILKQNVCKRGGFKLTKHTINATTGKLQEQHDKITSGEAIGMCNQMCTL